MTIAYASYKDSFTSNANCIVNAPANVKLNDLANTIAKDLALLYAYIIERNPFEVTTTWPIVYAMALLKTRSMSYTLYNALVDPLADNTFVKSDMNYINMDRFNCIDN